MLRPTRPDLTITVSELVRHWGLIVDAILPQEGAIGVIKRGRPVAVLIAPWLWIATQRTALSESDARVRTRAEIFLRARFPRQFAKPIPLEVGMGWLPLVGEMLADVESVLGRRRARLNWIRIYSKYASLRADFESPDLGKSWVRKIEAIVERYEGLSEKRCERCGKPGTVQDRGGWICVVCEEHAR